jgi:hypothetical protein
MSFKNTIDDNKALILAVFYVFSVPQGSGGKTVKSSHHPCSLGWGRIKRYLGFRNE